MNFKTFFHIKKFAKNLIQCSQLMGNPISAYRYLRASCEPDIGIFINRGIQFVARKQDWPAVRDVIVDDEYACVKWLITDGSKPRVLDLGANIGCFALRIFTCCPDAQVVSVEAAEDTFGIMRMNRHISRFSGWQIFNFAVWGADGPLILKRKNISLGHRAIEGDGDEDEDEDESIEGVSLLSLVARVGWDRIDLIKLDIEGGEESVIPASKKVLDRTRALIIEVHGDRIDAEYVMDKLGESFKFKWCLNPVGSAKKVYLMTNELIAPADKVFSRT